MVLCMLGRLHGLLGHLNGTEPSLINIITVKISDIKKENPLNFFIDHCKYYIL